MVCVIAGSSVGFSGAFSGVFLLQFPFRFGLTMVFLIFGLLLAPHELVMMSVFVEFLYSCDSFLNLYFQFGMPNEVYFFNLEEFSG